MEKLTPEQAQMVEENLPLITWYMQRRAACIKRHKDWQDMFQDGACGLCKAAMRYRPEMGIKFNSYALYYINGYISHRIRREIRDEQRYGLARLEDPTDESGEITLGDQIADTECGETQTRLIILWEILETLPDKEKDILFMHLAGMTQKEISRKMNISQSNVHRYLCKARRLVKDRMKGA